MQARQQGSAVTGFGTVTHDRIRYTVRKQWWGGGSEEDIPLRHVTAVRLELVRHPVWGIVLILLGLLFLVPSGGIKLLGLIMIGLGAYQLWPKPKVVVNTAGGDLRPSVGAPWTKSQAEEFVAAVRNQLFGDEAPKGYADTTVRQQPAEGTPRRQATAPPATSTQNYASHKVGNQGAGRTANVSHSSSPVQWTGRSENSPNRSEVQTNHLGNQRTRETSSVSPSQPLGEIADYCPSCGRKAPAEANFCPKCGHSLHS